MILAQQQQKVFAQTAVETLLDLYENHQTDFVADLVAKLLMKVAKKGKPPSRLPAPCFGLHQLSSTAHVPTSTSP